MFSNSFEFVEKILNWNYERKSVVQQQLKFSLNPELTNLESVGRRFTSKAIFEKDRNDPEERHTSNSIVYHLFVVIIENLPDGIYKNLGNKMKNMMKDKEKVGKNIFICDICHRKSFHFWKRKGRKNTFLHVIFPLENLFVFKTLFCNDQAFCYHPHISPWIYWGRQTLVYLWVRISYITLIFPFSNYVELL